MSFPALDETIECTLSDLKEIEVNNKIERVTKTKYLSVNKN